MVNRLLAGVVFSVMSLASQATDADSINGEKLFHDYGRGGCVNCHGANGQTPKMPLIPKVAGQSAAYLDSQLRDYKYQRRINGLYIPMQNVMETYSDTEIMAMATYLQDIKICASE